MLPDRNLGLYSVWTGPTSRFGKSMSWRATLFRLLKDATAATAIEYGLIAALMSIANIGALTTLGAKLKGNFGNVSAQLK